MNIDWPKALVWLLLVAVCGAFYGLAVGLAYRALS